MKSSAVTVLKSKLKPRF